MESTDVAPAAPPPLVSEAPPAAPAAPSASPEPAPATANAPPVVTTETAVLAMIDNSGPEKEKRVPLRDLQRACAKLPLLSTLLTGDRRYKLYVQLLLDEGETPTTTVVDTFEAAAAKATAAQRALAARVAAAFPNDHFSSPALVDGFVFTFATNMSCPLTPEESSVLVAMAAVVASGKLPTGEQSLSMLYHLMSIVVKDFMTSNSARMYDAATALLLRLLLQYQDPALSAHLDQHRIRIGDPLLKFTRSLFVMNDDAEAAAAALPIWDWIFLLGDPVLVPYVALAMLTVARQTLLALSETSAIEAALASFNVSLPQDRTKALDPKLVDGRSIALIPVWSGKSLCQNADLMCRSTPPSAQRVLEYCLCPESGSISKTPKALEEYYAGAPVLPLERSDIASSFSTAERVPGAHLQYVIVDCRSKGSYEYARLPTAVLVGDIVGFNPAQLDEVVERLRSSKGCHLSLFGTGRALVEEMNLLKVIALRLLRCGFPFVSLTTGGFKAIIPLIRSNAIRVVLNNGNPLPEDERHSLFAGFPKKITELRDAYLPADAEAAKTRAAEIGEEIREKAKEGLTTATTWGWDFFTKAQEKLHSAKEAASAAIARAGESTSATAPSEQETRTAATTTTQAPSAAKGPASAAPPRAPLQGRVAPPQPPVQIFTLGEEDDEDDFDLITAVPPPKPMRGTVVAEASPSSTAPAPATAAVSASAVATATSKEEERDEARHEHDGGAAAAVTTATTATAAAGDITSTHHTNSAAQIAASIDKEFDDLFGS